MAKLFISLNCEPTINFYFIAIIFHFNFHCGTFLFRDKHIDDSPNPMTKFEVADERSTTDEIPSAVKSQANLASPCSPNTYLKTPNTMNRGTPRGCSDGTTAGSETENQLLLATGTLTLHKNNASIDVMNRSYVGGSSSVVTELR